MKRLVVAAVAVLAVAAGGGAYWYYTSPREHAVSIDSVRVSGAVLYVSVKDGVEPCASDLRVSVEESADEVRIAARMTRDPSATCPAILMTHTAQVTLEAPLGDRRVVDERGDRGIDVEGRATG